jgi:regulator of replication initiation timing
MSGEKCARASLTEQARIIVEQMFNRSRALVSVLAAAANLVEQAESLGVDHHLKKGVREGLRQRLESFADELESFRGDVRKLQSVLDQIQGLHDKAIKDSSDQQAATSLGHEADRLADAIKRRMPEIESLMGSIADPLEQEQQSEKYHTQIASERNQRVLRGILGEVQWRMNPALPCSLSLVHDAAQQLETRLSDLITHSQQVTEPEVDEFRSQMNRLIEEAERIDRQQTLHRSLAQTLDRAFQEAGFNRVLSAQDTDDHGSVIIFQHRVDKSPLHVKVDSRVKQNGGIDLLMEGASGSGAAQLKAHEGCLGDLETVITQAKRLGLIIQDVLWKGPGGDWTALKIRALDTTSLQASDENTHTEVKSWKPQVGG